MTAATDHRLRIDHILACADSVPNTLSGCAGSLNLQEGIALNQWRSDAQTACAGIDVRAALGHAEPCGRAPRLAGAPVTDVASAIDCLASGVSSHLLNTAEVLYADLVPATNQCHRTLANGAMEVLRTALEQVYSCTQQPGAASVAACYAVDPSAWQAQAVIDCAGIDPYTTFGYRQTCDRRAGPVFPGFCPAHAYPCTFNNSTLSSSSGPSLLRCLTCQVGEAVLGVAGDLFGANLCCIGGTCNRVLTRVACFEAGGTPARYRMSSLAGVSTGGAHGIDVGPDGNLYMTGPGNVVTRVALPGGAQTTVGSTPFFPTGVAVDSAGNVYVTNRCVHTLTKIAPGGATTTFAGTATPGHSGDEGPATAAQIAAPDGIAVDAVGNVYFTESSLLSLVCGTSSGVGTERVRMVGTSGMIHTIAGGGLGPGRRACAGRALLHPLRPPARAGRYAAHRRGRGAARAPHRRRRDAPPRRWAERRHRFPRRRPWPRGAGEVLPELPPRRGPRRQRRDRSDGRQPDRPRRQHGQRDRDRRDR